MSLQTNFVESFCVWQAKQSLEEIKGNNTVNTAIAAWELKHQQHVQKYKRQEEPKHAPKETWMETLEFLNDERREKELKPNNTEEKKEDDEKKKEGEREELKRQEIPKETWMEEASNFKREQLKQPLEKQPKQPEQSKFSKGWLFEEKLINQFYLVLSIILIVNFSKFTDRFD